MLGKTGYKIEKSKLTTEKLKEVRKRLTVKPRETPYTNRFVDYSFKVYQEDANYIQVPRFYGIDTFGPPKQNRLLKNAKKLNQGIEKKLELRNYQKKAVEDSLSALRKYGGCIFQVQPAFGKTACSIYMAYELGYKTLVVVPRIKLLGQWKQSIEEFLPGAKVGLIQGTTFESEGYDFVVATLQTVGLKDFTGTNFKEFGFTIFDEIQFFASKAMSTVLWKCYSQYNIGLSATPERADGLDHIFYWYLGYSVIKSKMPIVRKFEPKVQSLWPEEQFYEIRIERTGNLNSAGMTNKLVESKERYKLVSEQIKRLLVNPKRKLLVLADRVQYIKNLAKTTKVMFPEREIGVYVGSLKKKEREELDMKIDNEEISVLFATYQLLSVGVSIDYLNTLILATPKKDKATEQATGRILRKDHDIQPIIVDIVDNNRIYYNQWRSRSKFYRRARWQVEKLIGDSSKKETVSERKKTKAQESKRLLGLL